MYKILENSQPFLRTTTQSAYKFMIDYFQVDFEDCLLSQTSIHYFVGAAWTAPQHAVSSKICQDLRHHLLMPSSDFYFLLDFCFSD